MTLFNRQVIFFIEIVFKKCQIDESSQSTGTYLIYVDSNGNN